MRKKIVIAVCTLLIGAASFAQQKLTYDANAEKRTVGSFHGIKVATGIDLKISQGNTEEVAVSAATPEDRIKIKTEVVNGVLKIYYDRENNWTGVNTKKKQLKAWVSFKSIDMLSCSSGSDATAEGSITATNFSLHVSSGADFTGSINCSSLEAEVSSGADANVSGKAETAEITSSSGADFHGYGFSTNTCNADASSGGDIEITATKELKAEASSGGGVYYKGAAVIKNFSKSSGGSITKQD